MRGAALGVSIALCVASQIHPEADAPDSNEREIEGCMERIEFVAPMLTLEPDLIACFQTAGGPDPGARAFDVQSRPAPRELPDGRRYRIIGATQFDIYAELKTYPDETAIGYVGQELRRLACKKGSDAILKARLSCGLCPDRQEFVPCVFAAGYFVAWVGSQRN